MSSGRARTAALRHKRPSSTDNCRDDRIAGRYSLTSLVSDNPSAVMTIAIFDQEGIPNAFL